MANLQNRSRTQNHSFLSSIGNKIKHVAQIAGGIKGIYDTGRMLYHAAQYIGPAGVIAAGIL